MFVLTKNSYNKNSSLDLVIYVNTSNKSWELYDLMKLKIEIKAKIKYDY